MFKIKPFDYLVVNSSGFDFAKKKIGYFSNIGKSLMIKKIILTDFPDEIDRKQQEKLAITRDPAEFISYTENLR